MCRGQPISGAANVQTNIGISFMLLSHLRNEKKNTLEKGLCRRDAGAIQGQEGQCEHEGQSVENS
jgi:hypothetical protein